MRGLKKKHRWWSVVRPAIDSTCSSRNTHRAPNNHIAKKSSRLLKKLWGVGILYILAAADSANRPVPAARPLPAENKSLQTPHPSSNPLSAECRAHSPPSLDARIDNPWSPPPATPTHAHTPQIPHPPPLSPPPISN